MKPAAVLGIDPGLNGALALWQPDVPLPTHQYEDRLTVFDVPTLEITVNRKRKRQIDLYELARFFDMYGTAIGKAVIEDVNAMPGQGVSSMFKFGRCLGVLEAMAAAHFIPIKMVRPTVWKKNFNLTADKDASRLAASRLLPHYSHLWSRAKDDGRAEAVLLALYGVYHA